MTKTRLHKLILLFAIGANLLACTKESFFQSENQSENLIQFSVDKSQTAKTSRVSGDEFEDQDKIGVYAYFNNYYYYYPEWGNYAESVIFADQELTVSVTESGTTTSYSPAVSWSFSSLYGTAPHCLDVVAYYPYAASENISLSDTGDDASTMVYTYSEACLSYDFMVASKEYYNSTATEFRTAMLELDYIPLSFSRKTAGVDIVVANISDSQLSVSSLEFHVDKTYSTLSSSEPFTSWSWGGELGSQVLTLSFEEAVSLSSSRESLVDSGVYFPDGTVLSKIVFNFSDSSFESYSWHPHIETLVANTPLVIYLDLDPVRLN